MAEYFNVGAALALDVLLQSTIILGAGLLVARSVRLPARQHAVLAIAFACALLTPLASSMVRVGGWGILAPDPVAVAEMPAVAADMPAATEMPAQRSRPAEFAETAAVRGAPPSGQNGERQGLNAPSLVTVSIDSPAAATTASSRPLAVAKVQASSEQAAVGPSENGSFRTAALTVFVAIWLACSLWAIARLLRSVFSGGRILATAEPCTSDAVEWALQLARERLGLGALKIEVLQSSSVRCPVIWCWGRHPRLVLPTDAVVQWSAATWTPILCHELAHWLRRDHLIALAAELGCCLLPWQPLAWWAKRRMEHSCEQACDDWAVATGHSPADYAETLLGLVAQNGSPLELAALRRRSGLAMRIRHILTERVPRPHLGRRWAVAVVSIAVMSAGTAAFCQRGVARAEPAPAKDAAPADTKPAAGNPKPAAPAMSGAARGGTMKGGFGSEQPAGVVGELQAADEQSQASTQPRNYTAAGHVIDPEGKPIAGATVIWEAKTDHDRTVAAVPVAEAKTDARGQFSLTAELVNANVPYSELLFRAAGFGLRGYWVKLDKLADPLEIRLDPSYPIEGTVFTPNGEPVRGARVTLTQLQRSSAGEDYNTEKPTWWHLSLSEAGLKTGTVRALWPAAVLTDENGMFRFEDTVPIPASARLLIESEGFANTPVHVKHEQTVLHPRDQFRDSYQEPAFTLVLENPWRVEGRFTDDKSGEPLAGVKLKVTQGTYGRGMNSLDDIHVTTDQDGRYKLLAGSADYYYVHVTPMLGYPGIQNSLNASTLEKLAGKGRKVKYDVKLRRGAVLHGRVVAEDTGEPVPDASVEYRLEKGRKIGMNSEFTSVKTAADGTFELTGTFGKGFLIVDAPNSGFYRQVLDEKRAQQYRDKTYPHGYLEIDIPEEGQKEPVTISLKRGRELVVRALSPSGEPVKKLASAYAEQEMNRYFGSEEAKDGFFRIKGAQPGYKYRVFLFSEDAMAGIVTELEVPEDGNVIDVKLEPTATIRGRYVFSGGGPAAEVSNFPHFRLDPQQEEAEEIEIFNLPFYSNFARMKRGDKPGTSTTDADGNFLLEGIVPGAFMYMSLNYKFEDGKTYRPVGTLAPGEVKDLGDVVIQSR